jgi:hypothetical protein
MLRPVVLHHMCSGCQVAAQSPLLLPAPIPDLLPAGSSPIPRQNQPEKELPPCLFLHDHEITNMYYLNCKFQLDLNVKMNTGLL